MQIASRVLNEQTIGFAGEAIQNSCPIGYSRFTTSTSSNAIAPVSLRKGRGAWVSAGLAMDTTANPVYYRGNLRGCSALLPATLEIRLGLNG
jgi:hypothetical protein